MQFTQGLHRAIQLTPNALATSFEGREQSFAELQNRVAKLAGAFANLGIKKGDCITILSFNSDKYIESYLAIAWLGAVVNPANFRWNNAEVIYSINDSQSCALIVDEQFSEAGIEIAQTCDSVKHLIYAGNKAPKPNQLSYETLVKEAAPIPDSQTGGDETFGIFYTGGTTGAPKGVMLSHSNICSSAMALMAEGSFPEGAIGLHLAPMFHLADMMMTTCLILRGGSHVICSTFDPATALQTIAASAVTDLLLVPAMLGAIVETATNGSYDTSSIARIMYGASPASETLLIKTLEAIPTAKLTQVYGMTEMAAVMTVLPPAMHESSAREKGMLRSGGRSACHVQIRIVDEKGNEMPRNAIGEIKAKGPNVMQRYLNKPEATEAAIKNGWMHTGDMGYLNEDGYLFIVDRLKDMIISGGENIYSAEVENVISKYPGIKACAVVGIPCDTMGEKVHAALVLENGAEVTQEALYNFCKQSIAGYKSPKSIEVLKTLPLSGAGKVLKTAIREPFWKGKDSAIN